MDSGSVRFFETQFQRQVRERDYALNPFEQIALDHLAGSVLDLGCGLGNLALEAARRGHPVVALDSSSTAIAHIVDEAAKLHLSIDARCVDLETHTIESTYDTIVSIGLLMFFPRESALSVLANVQDRVASGGRAIVNVLVEGTTFMDMFEPGRFHLFGREELVEAFSDWEILLCRRDEFAAPRDLKKVFSTVVAKKR